MVKEVGGRVFVLLDMRTERENGKTLYVATVHEAKEDKVEKTGNGYGHTKEEAFNDAVTNLLSSS